MTSLFAAVLLACSPGASPTGPDALSAVAHVEVEPSSVTAPVSDTAHVTATATDDSGAELDRAVSWTIQDPDVARVNSQGVVLARSGGETWLVADVGGVRDSARITVEPPGSSQPPAIPDGVTIREVQRTDSTVRYRADWGGANGAEEYPWDAGANNGGWIKRLFTLSSRSTRFEVERLSTDVQSFFCVEGLNPAGTSDDAACTGYTVPASSAASSPSDGDTETPVQESPTPATGDVLLVDTRAGGSQDIQGSSVGSLSEANAAVGIVGTFREGGWAFSTDFDGTGTNAWVAKYSAVNGDFGDRSLFIQGNIEPSRHVYIQWKQWMGRRSGDGVGWGVLESFDFTNPNDPVGNASRKNLRLLGDDWSGGNALWTGSMPGPEPVRLQFFDEQNFNVINSGNQWTMTPGQLENSLLVFTYRIQCESAPGAGDGALEVWVEQNGTIVYHGEMTRINLGAQNVRQYNVGLMIRSPIEDMSEYFWDLLIWRK